MGGIDSWLRLILVLSLSLNHIISMHLFSLHYTKQTSYLKLWKFFLHFLFKQIKMRSVFTITINYIVDVLNLKLILNKFITKVNFQKLYRTQWNKHKQHKSFNRQLERSAKAARKISLHRMASARRSLSATSER